MSRLSAVLIVFALALVALGIYDITRDEAKPAAPAPAPAAAPQEAAPPALELATARAPIGTVVTSGGETLYRFDKDTPKPPKSTCVDKCATTWPPLVATGGAPKVTGIDPALVGTVARADGTEQVTLNGWPLYTYAADGPGETKGEGVGGTWHAIGPSGKPAIAGGAATGPGAPAPNQPAPAPAPAPETGQAPDTGGNSGY